MTDQPPAKPLSPRSIALMVVTALLIAFAALSYSAALTKGPTYDEPLHLVGAYMHRFEHDYRINPEDPALFGWWTSIPMGRSMLTPDLNAPTYLAALKDTGNQWPFVVYNLYKTPGVDSDRMLNRSRAMFTLLGVLLAGLIAWWSWKLAGPIAAVVSTALFCLDPNFLGHASLIKNDVPLSLLMLALGIMLWQLRRGGKLQWIFGLGLICGCALNTKFSGLLFGPITAVTLVVAAMLPGDWKLLLWDFRMRWTRLAAAVVLCLIAALISYLMVWTIYDWRYSAVVGLDQIDTTVIEAAARTNEVVSANGGAYNPSKEEVLAHRPGLALRAREFIDQNHILPQGWTLGFLFTYMSTLLRSSFLMDEVRVVGFSGYYPLAMLFKTPLGSLALIAVSLATIGGIWLRKYMSQVNVTRKYAPPIQWDAVCLVLPPAIYFLAAVGSNLNIGLRHVLPVYPYVYVMAGVGAAAAINAWKRPAKIAVTACLVALGIEMLLAFPNYIAFFNAVAVERAGKLHLLSDSNLDWGQDLKELADWQKTHHDRPLFLSYFGIADPAHFGVDANHMIGGWPFAESVKSVPATPVYVAVSATNLQLTYIPLGLRPQYAQLRDRTPSFILGGGTIYIYEWNSP